MQANIYAHRRRRSLSSSIFLVPAAAFQKRVVLCNKVVYFTEKFLFYFSHCILCARSNYLSSAPCTRSCAGYKTSTKRSLLPLAAISSCYLFLIIFPFKLKSENRTNTNSAQPAHVRIGRAKLLNFYYSVIVNAQHSTVRETFLRTEDNLWT